MARQFSFQEYDAPILESAEVLVCNSLSLLLITSSISAKLVKRSPDRCIASKLRTSTPFLSYYFLVSPLLIDFRYEVALRPEMTPSLARLILKQGPFHSTFLSVYLFFFTGQQLLMPIRWFSIPQCWRFETTTRGRKREHYQWNMDIVGVSSVLLFFFYFAFRLYFFEHTV